MSFEIWTVYDHPADWPDWFVARKWVLDTPTGEVKLARSLDGVRRMLPRGLVRMGRFEGDDPVIVEIWL